MLTLMLTHCQNNWRGQNSFPTCSPLLRALRLPCWKLQEIEVSAWCSRFSNFTFPVDAVVFPRVLSFFPCSSTSILYFFLIPSATPEAPAAPKSCSFASSFYRSSRLFNFTTGVSSGFLIWLYFSGFQPIVYGLVFVINIGTLRSSKGK